MSTAILRNKAATSRLPELDRQIAQGKVLLRQLRDTLEDLDDRRDLARAKKRNAGRPGTSWAQVKKEFGFDF